MWKWIVGVPIALFAVFMVIGAVGSNTPEGRAKASARDAISLCWDEQKKASNTPAQARFIAGACESMETKFYTDYQVKP